MGSAHPRSLVFDAGALLALERANQRIRALLELSLKGGSQIVIPAGVLAQVWRDGAKQVPLSRLLRDSSVKVEALTANVARACGVLCGQSRTSDVIDASVVLAGVRHRAVILTSDPDDLRQLNSTVAIEKI